MTITGTNFVNVTAVTIGGGALQNLSVVSSTQIAGQTPAGTSSGAKDVVVSSSSNGSGTCTGCFTYNPMLVVSGVSPSHGPLNGGTFVWITWPDVVNVSSVTVGGRALQLVSAFANELMSYVSGITPAGSGTGPVDVVVYTTTSSGTCAGCFTYTPPVVRARYSVTFLGAGFDSSQAVDLNDGGSVVGEVWSAASGWRGRLWPNTGAATDLGVLLPVALNNGGSVVGNLQSDTGSTPALWENGAVRALGGLGALDPRHVWATDINDQRQVALAVMYGVPHAFLWRNDSLTPLQGNALSYGVGKMNRWGDVAGTCSDGSPYSHACVMSTGGVRGLGGSGRYSGAVALNDAGWAIGGSECVFALGGYCGFLFGYGRLPFQPAAINDSLQIVGEGSIWQDSTTASLTALVVDPAWQVSGASAINERGQIAAYGVNTATGARGAIRLDPVTPAPGPARRR